MAPAARGPAQVGDGPLTFGPANRVRALPTEPRVTSRAGPPRLNRLTETED